MEALCRAFRDRCEICAITNDIYTKEDALILTRARALPRSASWAWRLPCCRTRRSARRLHQPGRRRRDAAQVPGARRDPDRVGRRQPRRHLQPGMADLTISSSTWPRARRSRGRASPASPAPTSSSSTRPTSPPTSAPLWRSRSAMRGACAAPARSCSPTSRRGGWRPRWQPSPSAPGGSATIPRPSCNGTLFSLKEYRTASSAPPRNSRCPLTPLAPSGRPWINWLRALALRSRSASLGVTYPSPARASTRRPGVRGRGNLSGKQRAASPSSVADAIRSAGATGSPPANPSITSIAFAISFARRWLDGSGVFAGLIRIYAQLPIAMPGEQLAKLSRLFSKSAPSRSTSMARFLSSRRAIASGEYDCRNGGRRRRVGWVIPASVKFDSCCRPAIPSGLQF